ncbi:four helix bundle protein [Ilyomonas limi]|uniref:Four helix bundle protein n=1 Tax=Ilyomonas limi TaxID=2575867 RepID=A0A4U3LCM3_9BACT|nr:four helix bundle protein [Ilyomonas limi]TKK71637.1 four helix bundle protein [Ilyomonas limi]
MAMIKCFEEIEAWKLARSFYNVIGNVIDSGKFKNNFGLIDQTDRASGSIMDNIAEGFERGSRAGFIVFLGYAKGSAGEVRSQLYRVLDRKYLLQEEFNELYAHIIYISSCIQKFIEYLLTTKISGIRKKKCLVPLQL